MTEPNLYNVGYDVGFEDGLKKAQARIKELEAKLAKAVDVLGYYARNDDGGSIARTTIAELTGGNDG